MMKLRKFFALALMLGGALMATAQQDQPLPVDTTIHTGKLANGLTYYVRQNNYPEHRVNFYIAQRVGSIQEEESQRGLAHFLEHMAFNGTKNYPDNGVIDYTRTLGVQFGSDLNAYTSVDQTVYRIDNVPSARQSSLDSCLLILKDWSNGLLLEDDEIDKERGVIHEEWRLRSTASQRMLERNLEKLYPGSKYGKRMPIGLMSVVDGFKYDELRNYYKKWYRPDNQAIVVVGDVDVDYTVKKIQEMFGSIPAPAADAAQVVDEPVPDNEKAIVVIDKDKEQQYSIVQLCYKHEPFPENMKGGVMYMATNYMIDMVGNMLDARFKEKAEDPNCPFIQAGGGDESYLYSKTCDAFTLSALPKEGKTAEALQAIVTEALRAQKYGFTATEYARARSEYLSRLEKRYNDRNKISNTSYGNECTSNYLEKEPLTSIETDYQYMNMLAPNIPVEAINQMMAQLISPGEKNMVVINFNQEKEGAVYPTEAQLKGAIEAAFASDIQAYVDNVKDEPLMKEMPKKGKIVKETEDKKLGFKTLTLSNGATVVMKKTDFKADEIQMQAVSKGGSSLYGQSDWANTELFSAVIGASGLGNFSNTELEKALAGKQASASLDLRTCHESMSGKSTVKDLETMFQLAYLKFTNISKDQKSYDKTMNMLETMLKNQGLQPEAVFADSMSYTLGNHSWREKTIKAEDLKSVNYDRVLQIAKERFGNAADFTFYFVGNYDEAVLKGYIEQYIASLPGDAKKKENWKNVVEHAKGKVVNEFKHKAETPKAIAAMFWYNTKAPWTLESSIYASAAGQVLSKIYLKKIREDASAAYSASAAGQSTIEGDMPYTMVYGYCPLNPEKADIATKIMREEIVNISKDVDAPTLDEIKKLMVKRYETNAKENSHWMSVLNRYVEYGVDMQTDYLNVVNGMTPAKVAAFVKNVILAGGNDVEVIMLPAE